MLIETDHKPLIIPLLGSKHLDDLPPRILRFRLRLARVDYSIGKLLYTADALSRAPRSTMENDVELEEDTEHMMEVVVGHLPATKQKLCEYARAQASDPVCASIVSKVGQTNIILRHTSSPTGRCVENLQSVKTFFSTDNA